MIAMADQRLVMRSTHSAPIASDAVSLGARANVDVYFSADIETDGPIPGEFSMLSVAFVYAGRFDGTTFEPPENYDTSFEFFAWDGT